MCPGFESLIRHQIFGGIAQLVERLHGMQEVSGSIPLTSTREKSTDRKKVCAFLLPDYRQIKNKPLPSKQAIDFKPIAPPVLIL